MLNTPLTLLGTNISLSKAVLKMSFLFPRWDKLIPWRVVTLAEKYAWRLGGKWPLQDLPNPQDLCYHVSPAQNGFIVQLRLGAGVMGGLLRPSYLYCRYHKPPKTHEKFRGFWPPTNCKPFF